MEFELYPDSADAAKSDGETSRDMQTVITMLYTSHDRLAVRQPRTFSCSCNETNDSQRGLILRSRVYKSANFVSILAITTPTPRRHCGSVL